jgi:hypothetical protein
VNLKQRGNNAESFFFALMVLFVAGCGSVSYETKSVKSVRRGRSTKITVSKIQSSVTDCFTESLERKKSGIYKRGVKLQIGLRKI